MDSPRSIAAALWAAALLTAGATSGSALGARSNHEWQGSRCAHRASYRQGGGTLDGKRHSRCRRTGRRRRSTAACRGTQLRPNAYDITVVRSAVFCLVNRERNRRGLPPLRPNADLRRAAQMHTESMAFGGYFDHVEPGGGTPLTRMRAVGYISSRTRGYEVGENIAWGTAWLSTPGAIVAAWMASPEHRANILDRRFRDTAIGVAARLPRSLGGGRRGAIYTQDFGVVGNG